MKNKKLKYQVLNQKGQTLVFILLIMTIALAVGVAISSRTVSTVRRTTNVDTSSRALAVAEAAAEYYLARQPAELENSTNSMTGFTSPTQSPTSCTPATPPTPTVYPPVVAGTSTISSDIGANAQVSVRRVGCMNNPSNPGITFDIQQDRVLEFRINSTSNAQARLRFTVPTINAVALYVFEIYNAGGTTPTLRKTGYNMNNSSIVSSFSTDADNQLDYDTQNYPQVVRVVPIGRGTSITTTLRAAYNIPFQGYEITSVGAIGGSQNAVSRTIVATKSLPVLPAIFNFGVYAQQGSL